MNETSLNEIYLSRQPILNAKQELVGYELLLQSSANSPSVQSNQYSAAMLLCAAYAELGIQTALGHHKAFLRVDSHFLHDDVIEVLPSEGVVFQLALDKPPDEQTLERCRTLRERHYSLALADYAGLDEISSPLLTIVDFIKIDIRSKNSRQLLQLSGPLARLPIKLLAQGVETPQDFELCRNSGFKFFQGYHFARPEIVSGRRLSASQANIIQLINLTVRDAETTKLEDNIKRDPALVVNLLSIVNSVAYGFPQKISSLRHAIMVLGRRQLQRWLQLLLMTPAGKAPDPSRTPLLQIAALRARMMEVLVGHLHLKDITLAGQAFIVGIMSMMPVALGLSLEEILQKITLEQEIVKALQLHEGILGKILALIEYYDDENTEGCDKILASLAGTGIDRNMLNACLMDSLRWINNSEGFFWQSENSDNAS